MNKCIWTLLILSLVFSATNALAKDGNNILQTGVTTPAILDRGSEGVVVKVAQQGPQEAVDNSWRYRSYNGRWWYWLPENRWVYWDGGRWVDYVPGVRVYSYYTPDWSNYPYPNYYAYPRYSYYYGPGVSVSVGPGVYVAVGPRVYVNVGPRYRYRRW